MAKRKTLMNEFREELVNDRELNGLYQRELAKLRLANQILAARTHAGLTQAALARRIGTQQTGVARMENAGYARCTVSTLAKIAAATGSRLEVRLVTGGRRLAMGQIGEGPSVRYPRTHRPRPLPGESARSEGPP